VSESNPALPFDAATEAIHRGDTAALKRLLAEHPQLATERIGPRTLLHVTTDWPGHFPDAAAAVAVLVAAGADVNAAFRGRHRETPLHWAASSDDVAVLDALVEAGADIEAPGSTIGGGTPLADAVAFGQWRAARRLIDHGARPTLWQAAALGLLDRIEQFFSAQPPPTADEITNAFWSACHGGQRQAAEYLHQRGADMNWIGYDNATPLDIARRAGADDVVQWLLGLGAKPAANHDSYA